MKRFLRISAWALGALGALVVAGVGVLHLDSVRYALFHKVQQQLRAYDIDLRVGQLDYSLPALKVWIQGLEVRAAGQPDLPPLLAARRVELSARWRTVWSGEIDIERFVVDQPAVAVVFTSEGASNLPQVPADEEPDDTPFEPPRWRADAIHFQDGTLLFRDAAADIEFTLPHWRLDMVDHGLSLGNHQPGAVRVASDSFTLKTLYLQGKLHPASLTFEDTRFTIEADLAPFTPGAVQLAGTVEGRRIDAHLQGNGFDHTLAAALSFDPAGERLEVHELRARGPYGTLEARGAAALSEDAGETRLNATARLDRNLPLAARATIEAEAWMPGLDADRAQARVRLQGEVREFEGVRFSGDAAMDAARRLRGRLLLRAPDLGAVDEALRGEVEVNAAIAGAVDDPRITAVVTGRHLGADVIEEATLDARIAASMRAVEITELALGWRDQWLHGTGTVDLEKRVPEILFEAKTSDFSLENSLAGAGFHDVPVRGLFALSLHAAGPVDNIAASAGLEADGLEAYQEALGRFTLQASYRNGRAAIEEARLDKPGSEPLHLSGEFDIDSQSYRYALDTRGLRLERLELPDGTAVRGLITLSSEGAGTVEEPALTLAARVDGLTVDELELGSLELNSGIEAGAATAEFAATKYALKGRLRAGIEAPYLSSFEIEAAGTDLAALPLPEDLPLTGKLRAVLKGDGPLETPEKLNARLTLDPEAMIYQGQAIATEGPLDVEVAGLRLHVRQGEIRTTGVAVSLAGEFPLENTGAPGELRLQAKADLAALPQFIPDWPESQKIEGAFTLDGAVRGTLEKYEPEARVALTGGRFEAEGVNPVTGLALEAALRNGLFELTQLAGEWAGAKLSGTASAPWPLTQEGAPAQVEIALAGLDPARIQGAPEQTSGLISLRLTAQTREPELEALTAALTFDELRLRLSDIPLAQRAPATVRLERGEVRVEEFTLTGPGTELRLGGRAGLLEKAEADFRFEGRMETGLLAGLLAPLRLRGPATVDFRAAGPLDDLKMGGHLELTNLEMNVPEPRLAAEAVNARIEFDGSNVTLARLSGLLNGGKLSGKGRLAIENGTLGATDIEIAAAGVYLDYPADFRTVSNTELRFRNEGKGFRLSGGIDLVEGAFREMLTLETGLLAYLNSEQGVDLTDERNEVLERTRLDLGLKTSSPLLINNNLARAEVNVDLRVVGTPYRPSLLGRIELEEGGELYLAERTYPVERGRITFTNEQRIEPTLDILARTRAGGLDITLQVEGGGAERLETRLTSDPPEPEPDIIAVLITGRPLEEIRGSDASTMASRQVMSYLAGSLGGRFTREIERATGLSKVRVEPDLIAAESNPTARLTVGQDITRDTRLIYSMNLANGGDQVWVAEHDLTRRFLTRGIKQADNTYRFEVRHDLRFGGDAAQRREARADRRVGEVTITGNQMFDEQRLRKRLKARPGRRYDFFNIRAGLDRIAKDYDKRDRLEARLRLEREAHDNEVDLSLTVDEGPRVALVYEGWSPTRKVRKQVRGLWRDGVFDGQRLDETARALREALVRRGHFEAVVEAGVEDTADDERTVTFRAEPGLRYRKPALVFEGNEVVASKELTAAIDKGKLRPVLFLNPRRVTDLMRGVYRERGYLDTAAAPPQVEFDREAARATVTLKIEEGPKFAVGEIRVAGNAAFETNELIEKMPLRSGESYTPALRQEAVDRVLDVYLSAGYTAAQVESRMTRTSEAGRVNLDVQITEGPQQVVESLDVEGERAVSERLIRSQLALKPGDTVDPSKVSLSRRRLYATGAFALVDVERIPLSPGANVTTGQQPIVLRARVREVQPFDIRYGAYYDTDRGMGAVVDVTNRNSLGSARTLGWRGRLDREIRETRFFFSQPLLQRLPLQTIATTYLRREMLPDFINDRTGVSAQQELRFRERYTMNYGYRLENVRTYDRVPDPFFPFDISLRVAPLTWTLNRESRDDLLDATRGSFTSHSLEYAPAGIGSQLNFVRYYGQFFKYVPLSAPTEVPLGGGIRRSRLVYAGAVRVGLASGLRGQELVRSERFFTGGGTTLRGFALNTVGPVDFFGDATGGDALLLVNNELRFPLISLLEGVAFSDIGNVYPSIRDMSLRDIRKTGGGGVRVRTPYFLLRVDYGFILDRRPGEGRGGLFFSIGQAF